MTSRIRRRSQDGCSADANRQPETHNCKRAYADNHPLGSADRPAHYSMREHTSRCAGQPQHKSACDGERRSLARISRTAWLRDYRSEKPRESLFLTMLDVPSNLNGVHRCKLDRKSTRLNSSHL